MSGDLLISVRPGEVRAVLMREGRMVWHDAIRTLSDNAEPPVGAVVLGRVRKVDPGLEAAFVDIGGDLTALLSVRDAGALTKGEDRVAIERTVQEGAAVPVRVIRASRDGKGPRVSADLSGCPSLPELHARAGQSRPPAILWRPPTRDPALMLVERVPGGWTRMHVDHQPTALVLDRAGYGDVTFVRERDLFAAHGADAELDLLAAASVPLEGGGSLVIESTAALTAIDVNAGGRTASTAADMALKVNLAAVAEAARQIALRRIGGVVVIDFLRMKPARHRNTMLEAFRAACGAHGLGAEGLGFTRAGLMELVLPRHAETPPPASASCAVCGGTGRIQSDSTAALRLLALVARTAGHAHTPAIAVRAAPQVLEWIAARGPAVSSELERFGVLHVTWEPRPGWPPARMEAGPAPPGAGPGSGKDTE